MKILYGDTVQSKARIINPNERNISTDAIKSDFGGIGKLENVSFRNKAKTKNRFAHVFWSKPSMLSVEEARWNIGNQYELTLPLAMLSLALLKQHNQEVVLYTDKKGKELLGDLGYDKVYEVLEDITISKDFWACGKIIALKNEPLDSTIIDTDLFLYDGNLIDKLSLLDVAGSHEENTNSYIQLLQWGASLMNLKGDNSTSTNTGLLKINDIKKKFPFTQKYLRFVNQHGHGYDLERMIRLGGGAYCPDLLCEQYNFHKTCSPEHLIEVSEDREKDYGLTHLISFEKYLKIPYVIEILKEKYPTYHQTLIKIWEDLNFSVEYNIDELSGGE